VNKKEFILLWAKYVRTHSDKEWGRQQKILIDSQVKNVTNFTKRTKLKKILIKKYRAQQA